MKNNLKKSINILSVLFLILLLSSCFGWNNQDEVEKAKQEMWITEQTGSMDEDTGGNIDEETASGSDYELYNSTNNEELAKNKVEINTVTEDQFIELDDLSDEDFSDWEFELKWTTTEKVDKIIIKYENADSEYPKDVFTLKQFKAGDKTFVYRAFSRYQTFDYGKNVYTIEAYSWDKLSKTELVINYNKDKSDKEKTEDSEKKEVVQDLSVDTLPKNTKYGNPTKLWSGKIWYSDIKWLEIKKTSITDLTCANLTDVYTSEVGGYFFWNTCRPLWTDNWISFFIIRLEWDKYYYEKHYYLADTWTYWVQELESWEWVSRDTLEAKNTELKVKNAEYQIIKITDGLFNDLMK